MISPKLRYLPEAQTKKRFKIYKAFPWEPIIVTGLLIIFLLIGWLAGSRLNPVWLDEVLFTDPAANFYLGNGFTSSAVWNLKKDDFYAHSSLLYPLLLFGWLKLFGFSIVKVRLLNFFLIAISVLTIWLSTIRLRLINSSWGRISLVIILLCGEGITFSYVSGRYDSLCILLSAFALLAYSIKNNRLRYICLAFLGMLFPITGLALCSYSINLGFLLIIYLKRLFLKEYISSLFGSAIGIIFLYFVYTINGVWNVYFKYSTEYSIVNNQGNTNQFLPGFTRRLNLLFTAPQLLGGVRVDKSFQILVIITVILVLYQIFKKQFKFNSFLSFGLISIIYIPIVTFFLSKYPIYYSWMAFIPLSICVCSSITEIVPKNRSYPAKLFLSLVFLVLLVNASYFGLPNYLIKAVSKWEPLDYTKVENFIETTIREDDIAYSDYTAFYAIKKKADFVFFPLYVKEIISAQEEKNISVIVFDPRPGVRRPWNPPLKEVTKLLGGEWYDTGDFLNTKAYHLKIYRRKPK